jgi:hypothetical protein
MQWRCLALGLTALMFVSCASVDEPLGFCGGPQDGPWTYLAIPPNNAAELQSTRLFSNADTTVADALPQLGRSMHEAWFQNPNGKFRYCRYPDTTRQCSRALNYADFYRINDKWRTDGPPIIVCARKRTN